MRDEEIHMKKSRLSEHQILESHKRTEAGTLLSELAERTV